MQVAEDLKRIELRYHDRSEAHDGKIHLDNLFAALTMPNRASGEQRWTVVLPAALFRIFDLRRNAIVDLKARAAIRSEFGRWLHAFFSSQEPELERRYDALALCAAGGIKCSRATDSLKLLRKTISVLVEGQVTNQGKARAFTPLVKAGWWIEKCGAGTFHLIATRSPARSRG